MRYPTSVGTLGALLRVWREEAGLRIDDRAEMGAGLLPPSYPVGRTTLYRYETNNFPKRGPDAIVIKAWAVACGRPDDELPPEVQDTEKALVGLLRKSCFPVSHRGSRPRRGLNLSAA